MAPPARRAGYALAANRRRLGQTLGSSARWRSRVGISECSGLAAVAVVGTVALAAASAAALSDPHLRQLHNSALAAGLTTLAGVAALLAGWVALQRAEDSRLLGDYALAAGVLLVWMTSLLLGVLAAVGPNLPTATVAWLAVPGRLVAATLLVCAGWQGRTALASMPSRFAVLVAIAALTAALAAAGAVLGPAIGAPGAHLGAQLATVVLYLAAAAALARRANRSGDGVLRWYAAACGAFAYSRILFTATTPRGASWISPGDFARLVTSVLLVTAVEREVAERRRRAREDAIEQERRRLAREIHDGLAQELAFIVSQSRRLMARTPDADGLKLLFDAGQSALIDARRTIFKMSHRGGAPLSATVVERTFALAARAGLAVDVEVQGRLDADARREHELVRILGEAVSNAARHAHASRISIRVSSDKDKVLVRVADDGDGFDPHTLPRRTGFGLSSMKQRAESLGGHLSLESRPGGGTVIEVGL